MPSAATARNRLEKQGVGENANTWGTKLNTDLDLLDDALDGVTSFSLSGPKTLSNANYAADEARSRVLNVTSGTGGTITIPNVEKVYLIRNSASGNVTITSGSGTTAIIPTMTSTWIFCNGANAVYSIDMTDLWTYKRIASNFTRSASINGGEIIGFQINAGEVTANHEYEFEGIAYVKISSGSMAARLVWMAGLTDGMGELRCNTGSGEIIAADSVGAASFDTAAISPGTAYRPLFIRGHFIPSASKNGDLSLAVGIPSGTATITVRAGSFIKFRRTYP